MQEFAVHGLGKTLPGSTTEATPPGQSLDPKEAELQRRRAEELRLFEETRLREREEQLRRTLAAETAGTKTVLLVGGALALVGVGIAFMMRRKASAAAPTLGGYRWRSRGRRR